MLLTKFRSPLALTRFRHVPKQTKINRRARCSAEKSIPSELDDVFLEYDPSPLHLIHTMLKEAKLQAHETFLDLYEPQMAL